MASTYSLNKKPYRRVPPDDWLAIEAMYRAGATAKALAFRYDISERTLYGRARAHGWLRRDHGPTAPPMTEAQAEAAARALGAVPVSASVDRVRGDAACRGLAADAPLDVAARAAARSAIGMLRDGNVGPAQTYARVAGLLARLGPVMEDGAAAGGARALSPQDAAALAFVLERLEAGEEG